MVKLINNTCNAVHEKVFSLSYSMLARGMIKLKPYIICRAGKVRASLTQHDAMVTKIFIFKEFHWEAAYNMPPPQAVVAKITLI